MSLLWNDHLLIALFPDRAVLLRVSAGWQPKVIHKSVIDCIPDSTSKWRAIVTSLASTLSQKEWQGTRIKVVLSQHFLRVALMPETSSMLDRREAETFARHRITEATGSLTDEWKILLAEEPPGRKQIAFAVEQSLIENLRHISTESGNRLVFIRPFFSAAFDTRRKHCKVQHTWFAAVEKDHCVLARLESGKWKSITSRRIFNSAETELPTFLEQESIMLEQDQSPSSVLIVAPEFSSLVFNPDRNWTPKLMPINFFKGLSPYPDIAYATAMEAWN